MGGHDGTALQLVVAAPEVVIVAINYLFWGEGKVRAVGKGEVGIRGGRASGILAVKEELTGGSSEFVVPQFPETVLYAVPVYFADNSHNSTALFSFL
jgi:hypothetical protein